MQFTMHSNSQFKVSATFKIGLSIQIFLLGHENGVAVSLLDSVLLKTEQMNASIARFRRVPDHPFFPEECDRWHVQSYPDLPETAMLTNVNCEIYRHYIDSVLPRGISLFQSLSDMWVKG